MGSQASFPPSEGQPEDSVRQLDNSARLDDASQSVREDLIQIKSNAMYDERTLEVDALRR